MDDNGIFAILPPINWWCRNHPRYLRHRAAEVLHPTSHVQPEGQRLGQGEGIRQCGAAVAVGQPRKATCLVQRGFMVAGHGWKITTKTQDFLHSQIWNLLIFSNWNENYNGTFEEISRSMWLICDHGTPINNLISVLKKWDCGENLGYSIPTTSLKL